MSTEATESTAPVQEPILKVVPKAPTQEEINDQKRQYRLHFKNKIEEIKPQVELMEQRMLLAKYTFEHYQYSVKLDEIRQREIEAEQAELAKKVDDVVTQEHIITQEDIEKNPDLVGHGVKVGDTITINMQDAVPATEESKPSESQETQVYAEPGNDN